MTPQEQIDKWRIEGKHHCQYMYEDKGKIFGRYTGEIKPCEHCGSPAGIDAQCDNCWEVLHRIRMEDDMAVLCSFYSAILARARELNKRKNA